MDTDVTSITQVAGLQFLSNFGTPEIFYWHKEVGHSINSFCYRELNLTQLVLCVYV